MRNVWQSNCKKMRNSCAAGTIVLLKYIYKGCSCFCSFSFAFVSVLVGTTTGFGGAGVDETTDGTIFVIRLAISEGKLETELWLASAAIILSILSILSFKYYKGRKLTLIWITVRATVFSRCLFLFIICTGPNSDGVGVWALLIKFSNSSSNK